MSRSSHAPRSRHDLLAAVAHAARQHSTAAVLFHGAVAARLGLSATDMKSLDLLVRLGPLTAGELGRHTGLATASVTGLIDRLERRGYVRRRPDAVDRRRVIVELVPDRLAAIEAVFDTATAPFVDLLDPYADEHLAVILDFLERSAARARAAIARLAEMTEREA